mgnify:CR=1 FL=1
MAEIPKLKHEYNLPVSFKLFNVSEVYESSNIESFFPVEKYKGLAKMKPFNKNYSKSINWDEFIKK